MNIKKVICYNDFNFILDRDAQRLLKFNIAGEFIQQIGRRGQGPGKYLEIQDFGINEKNENIIIPDIYKLHVYSYKLIENADCKFLSTEESKNIISTLNQYSNPVLMITKPK